MPTRIRFSHQEIRVSKPGFDVSTNDPDQLVFYGEMNTMAAVLAGQCYLSGSDGRYYFNLPSPIAQMPYVILTSDDGVAANRYAYFCEMRQDSGAYRSGTIRNIDGRGRNIWFTVHRGF